MLLRWMNGTLQQDQVSWLLLSGFLHQQQDELLPIAEFDVKFRRQAMRQPEQDLETFLTPQTHPRACAAVCRLGGACYPRMAP